MNKSYLLIVAIVLFMGAAVYYQQHTHTASIGLPDGKDIGITTHD